MICRAVKTARVTCITQRALSGSSKHLGLAIYTPLHLEVQSTTRKFPKWKENLRNEGSKGEAADRAKIQHAGGVRRGSLAVVKVGRGAIRTRGVRNGRMLKLCAQHSMGLINEVATQLTSERGTTKSKRNGGK